MYLAPRWAFSAQAIDATGDPRLAKGVHVRALPSDALGLPAAPLVVYRLPADFSPKLQRSDVRWVDSHGAVLSYPFNVTPGNPVTGWLPAGTTCCWFSMEGAASSIIIKPPFPFPIGPISPILRDVIAHPAGNVIHMPAKVVATAIHALDDKAGQPPARLVDTGKVPVLNPGSGLVDKFPIVVPPTIFNRLAAFQLDAVVATARGPAVVSTRTGQPYQVAASHIEQVVVHGSGTVTGAHWIDASAFNLGERLQLWKQWSMPVHSAARYAAGINALDGSKQRTLAGAPTRHGLYQEPSTPSVASDSAATAIEELQRVAGFAPSLNNWLQTLVSDTSASQWSLTHNFSVQAGTDASNPDTQGTASMPVLGMSLQAIADPGLARWAGFYDVDAAPPTAAGSLAFYIISGVWALDRTHTPQSLIDTLPIGSIFHAETTPLDKRMPVKVDAKLPPGEYVELWVVAVATIGAPGNPPASPLATTQPGTWMPSPPSAPIRQIPIDASGMVPGAILAFARQDATGIVPLNPVDQNGKPLPLVPSPSKSSTVSGVTRVTDRKAPPGALTYRLSQSDWFGRFSPWTFANAPDQARTAPPKPTPEIFYTPPTPAGTAPLAGKLLVRVPVPADSALPPGCGALTGLILSAQASGITYTVHTTYPAAGGGGATLIAAVAGTSSQAPKPAMLSMQFDGPALSVAASTTVTLRAQWQTATATSIESDPVQRFIGDPRPVPPPPIPSSLRYSAKPDAINRSRFELALPALTGAKYRVYFADENQLLNGLRNLATSTDPQTPAALKAQAAASVAALTTALALNVTDRAAAFILRAAQFSYDMFQNLTITALDAGTFAHTLPGDLKTLSFYRVLTWNAANVPSDFATSPLVPVAVPNDPPPARPALSVTPVKDASGHISGAALTVRIAKSAVAPVYYRIRRSFAGATPDPRRMLVIFEGNLAAGNAALSGVVDGPNGFTFIHTDSNGIKPWHRYAWAVEVRGGAPIGAPGGTTLHGDYGPPSKPASTMIVPPTPPATVATFAGVRDGTGKASLHWTVGGNALEMMSTDLGPHKFELYRIPSGARPVIVPMATPPQPGADSVFRFVDPDTPTGSVAYSIVVVDPLGRASLPSNKVNL